MRECAAVWAEGECWTVRQPRPPRQREAQMNCVGHVADTIVTGMVILAGLAVFAILAYWATHGDR